MLKNGSEYNLLKLQKSDLPSSMAIMKITLLRLTLVFLNESVRYFCQKMLTNLRISKKEMGFLGIKQILKQRVSFQRISVTVRNTYH